MVTVYQDPTLKGAFSNLGQSIAGGILRRAERLERQREQERREAREERLAEEKRKRESQSYQTIADIWNNPGALEEGVSWEEYSPFQKWAHVAQLASERGADPSVLGGVLNNLLQQDVGFQKEGMARRSQQQISQDKEAAANQRAQMAADARVEAARARPAARQLETTAQKEFAKRQIARNEQVMKQGSDAEKMLTLIPEVKAAIPNAGAGSWNNSVWAPVIRKTKELFGDPLITGPDQVLNNFSKDWIKSMAPRWGANVTNQQTKLSRAMTVSPEKSPEANMKAIQLNEIALQAAAKEAQVVRDLQAKYLEEGDLPTDFDMQVDQIKSSLGRDTGNQLLRSAKELGFDVEVEEKVTFETLPPAKKYDGRVVKDNKSGKKFRSVNGRWVAI